MAVQARIPVAQSAKAPANPAAGGHYVKTGNNWQLIHAVGKGKWAPGPVPTVGGMSVNNPLLNPNQALSGASLYNAAQGLTDAQTAGPLAELAKQIAAQNAQTQGTMKLAGQDYTTLGNQAQQGVTDEQNIANALNAQLKGIAGNTNTQLQGIGQSAQNSLNQYSPGDPTLSAAAQSSLAQEMARQQGLAAQSQGAQQAFGATQGANYSGLAGTQLGTNAAAATQALKGIAQSGTVKNEPLLAKVANIQASRGALLSTNLGKLRQQEVNNQVAEQGLGLKSQSLQAAAAQNAARNQLTARAQNITERGQNITLNGQQLAQMSRDRTFQLDKRKFGLQQAKDTYERAHGLGPYRPSKQAAASLPKTTPTGTPTLSPLQQQEKFGQVDTVRQLIPQMQAPLSDAAAKSLQKVGLNVKAGQKLTEGQIRHLLAVGIHPGGNTRYDPGLVDAAYALAGWGYLTQKQITELNKLGLIVGSRYKRGGAGPGTYVNGRKVRPSSTATGGPGTNQGGTAPPGR